MVYNIENLILNLTHMCITYITYDIYTHTCYYCCSICSNLLFMFYWFVLMFLGYSEYKYFFAYVICEYFLSACSLSFYFLNVIFSGTKGFILANLSLFFKDHAFGFTSNNSLPKCGHE